MPTPPRAGTHTNPYAADGSANNYGLAVEAGADPVNYSDSANPQGAGNHFWTDGNGWAPRVTHNDFAGTPDPTRVEELPRTDRRANLRAFWSWWRGVDADTKQRESVTVTQATGFTELKGQRTRAADPRWVPPPEPRPTTAMNPHTFYFSRPFDQVIARMFNGSHMSLADNRRNYPIMTMSPIPHRRNTYRVEPSPWDHDIVDEPSTDSTTGRPDERLAYVDVPISTYRRSYRAM